jgi:BarA-like signal transduction histidine kinase
MLKPNQQHADLMDYAITSLSNADITNEQLSKVITVVGRVIESLDGHNLDWAEWYAIKGKGGLTMKKELLNKAITIRQIVLTAL